MSWTGISTTQHDGIDHGGVPGAGFPESSLFLYQNADLALPSGINVPLDWVVRHTIGTDFSLDVDTQTVRVANAINVLVNCRVHVIETAGAAVRLLGPYDLEPTSMLAGNPVFVASQPLINGFDNTFETTYVWRLDAGAHWRVRAQISGNSTDGLLRDRVMSITRIP